MKKVAPTNPLNSHEIVIETPACDTNGVLHWVEFTTIWGLFKVKEGLEQEIVVRYLTGLSDKMRVRINGRSMAIKSWKPLGRHHLIIRCEDDR